MTKRQHTIDHDNVSPTKHFSQNKLNFVVVGELHRKTPLGSEPLVIRVNIKLKNQTKVRASA